MLVALHNLDEVIKVIRRSQDADVAKENLIKKFRLSDLQAQAILDMPLRRLAALERKKLEDEYKELEAQIKELESLLKSPKKMRQVVSDDLLVVKERHGDRRKTQIVTLKEGQSLRAVLTSTDLAPEKTVWVSVTAEGLISRTQDDKPPRPSGREAPVLLASCNTRHTLYLVNHQGETAAIAMQALPETDKPGEGVPFNKVSPLKEKDLLRAVFSLPVKSERGEESYVLTVTRQGMVKKSSLAELPGPSAHSFTLVKINDGDALGWLRVTDGKSDLLLLSERGMAIRFSEDEVRPMGLVAAGVLGMKLAGKDILSGMEILPHPGEVLIVASDGSAKRIAADQFPRQGRYGQGVIAWKLSGEVKTVGMVIGKGHERITLHLAKQAPKSMRIDEAPYATRAGRGKPVLDLKPGDEVLYLTISQDDNATPTPKAIRKPSGGSGTPGTEKSPRPAKPVKMSAAPPEPGLNTAPKTSPKGTTKSTSAIKPATVKTQPNAAGPIKPAAGRPAASKAAAKPTLAKKNSSKPVPKQKATQLSLLDTPLDSCAERQEETCDQYPRCQESSPEASDSKANTNFQQAWQQGDSGEKQGCYNINV